MPWRHFCQNTLLLKEKIQYAPATRCSQSKPNVWSISGFQFGLSPAQETILVWLPRYFLGTSSGCQIKRTAHSKSLQTLTIVELLTLFLIPIHHSLYFRLLEMYALVTELWSFNLQGCKQPPVLLALTVISLCTSHVV